MKLNRRTLLVNAALLSCLGATVASAGQPRFDAQAFEAAQAAGKPILVHVTAPWCGACKAQKAVVAKLVTEPPFASMTIFEVDFDSQKDVLRTFGVRQQSTMIVFKGRNEVGREVGESYSKSIEALLSKAL